jgi:hypothetical protein
MRLTETLIFYLLVGIVVAVAMYLSDGKRSLLRISYVSITSLFFWPLYLPLLLTTSKYPAPPDEMPKVQRDEMARAIEQVETELKAALSSLEGWPDAAMARERNRVEELRTALVAQATRIREMDELLIAVPPNDLPSPDSTASQTWDAAAADRFQKSQQARQSNFTRLEAIRRKSYADLMATLAWVRELVSMIHLAKFTGAPASRTEELVAQIEAAVEGISRVDWPEETAALREKTNTREQMSAVAIS